MSASKNRTPWAELPAHARSRVEELADGRVVAAENCAGGFSPGFASRLTLAGGRRVFAKAMDAREWPFQASLYRDEAAVAAILPPAVPAPRFLGSSDDGHWVVLAFECVDGAEPARPWRRHELARVVTAVGALSAATTPSPVALPADHPRLGGWAEFAADQMLRAGLPDLYAFAAENLDELADLSAWADKNLGRLAAVEAEGLIAARGDSLVHFDLFPHNILLTPDRGVTGGRPPGPAADRVLFVDWPHARLGAPVIDLLSVLMTAAADGIDPEPLLPASLDRRAVTGVLAAMAGFCLVSVARGVPPGLAPIAAAKLELGRGALRWLRYRVTSSGW
jgi:hypothetical protein